MNVNCCRCDGLRLWCRARLLPVWLAACGMVVVPGARAEDLARATDQLQISDLADLPLEQLMEIRVLSVSKKEERLSEAAAAVHVISQDEIRRSGFRLLPEALRLAPGLQVARVDAHQWAISARGFNDVFANKLLVMIDGRSVYTPLFSGVFWDVQDVFLPDIDRIEVIRGPGATLWGANAVNGVINVITKSAEETQGLWVLGGAGTEHLGFGGLRYGGQFSSNAFYRVYAKYLAHDDFVHPDGSDANDRWQMGRSGFRVDWNASEKNLLTVQGDIYSGELNQTYARLRPSPPFERFFQPDHSDVSGGNLLGRWTHDFSADSELVLQAYYDRTMRDSAIFKEDRDTVDFDAQHRFVLGDRQEITWGGGYRLTRDDVRNSFEVALDPDEPETVHLFSAFVQDEIRVVDDRLWLTLGSKFEHNDYTGFEIQPSTRLAWRPHRSHMFWTSVARAVRTPSRAEDSIRLNQPPVFPRGALFGPNPMFPQGSPPAVTSIFGDDDFGSEELIAYEAGYRLQAHERLSFDLAVFYNEYDELRALVPGDPQFRFAPGHPGVPPAHISRVAVNELSGETYGGEIVGTWRVSDWWRLQASYSFLEMQIHAGFPKDGITERNLEGSSPHHQVGLRSLMDLGRNWHFDWGIRYVDQLAALGVPSYLVLDTRLAWNPTPNLEVALVGLNLLDDRHPEFVPTLIATQRTEVQHSLYGMVTWRF